MSTTTAVPPVPVPIQPNWWARTRRRRATPFKYAALLVFVILILTPLYILLVHTPLALLACITVARQDTRRFLWFLLLTTTVHVAAVQVLGVEPSPRHLHSAAVMLALAVGVFAAKFFRGISRSKLDFWKDF